MRFAEASLVIPITFLIVLSLIGIVMGFHGSLEAQIKDHEAAREEQYEKRESTEIMIYDALKRAGGELADELA